MSSDVSGTEGKRATWVQICWIIAQAVMTEAGILAICNPGKRLSSISIYLGISTG